MCEKHLQNQQDLYHVFIYIKKVFYGVWHAALGATIMKYNISAYLVRVIEQLYDKDTSAVLNNGNVGEWFHTTVRVRQGCLLSPTLFNSGLERLMTDTLEECGGAISNWGRMITNLQFVDITGLADKEKDSSVWTRTLTEHPLQITWRSMMNK